MHRIGAECKKSRALRSVNHVVHRLLACLSNRRVVCACLTVSITVAVFSTYIVIQRCDHYGCIPRWLYNNTACFEPIIPGGIVPQFYRLITEFHRHCAAHNITYIPIVGTLLGLYRHAGMVPWDDDFDLLVSWKQHAALVASLNHSRVLQTFTGERIWRVTLRQQAYSIVDRFGWYFRDYIGERYPCIDVFYYAENVSHLWATHHTLPQVVFRKRDVFPLTLTAFDHVTMWAPRRAAMPALLRQLRIDWSWCENSPHYKVRPWRKSWCHNVMIPCCRLARNFGFVPGTIDYSLCK